ncbi:MAG: hypothetical protein K6U02_05685 [Firmicutes bacterium]|nr:hypothetical protein [Bacillota bacterium]
MGSQGSLNERRRGERVLIRIPVTVRVLGPGEIPMEDTETVVVSQYGALLRFSRRLPPGTPLEIKNRFSNRVEKFRVVWSGETAHEGRFDLGVEILNSESDFWGIRFPAKERSST